MIYIESKKRKIQNIEKQYPGAYILDITSASPKRYAQILSPFYPHGGIPIPNSRGMTATCVEAIWQGLKVFQSTDIDISMFKNDTMKGLKRTVRRFGKPLGHRYGVDGTELLSYFDARMKIYLPAYKWVLDNVDEVHATVQRIADKAKESTIVLLDYNTNTEFRDTSSPLSHAGLVKMYIEGNYPNEGEIYSPMTEEEMRLNREAKKQKKSRNSRLDNELQLF